MSLDNTTKMTRWMLPEGIEEVLPAQAQQLEQLRRRLLDYFSCCGYQQVIPPFIEYLDALLAGTGQQLESQTFQITDTLSGKQMGIRADMTLQAARIDAHQIKLDCPVRLCYLGTVLRSYSDDFAGSRAPLQVGAELYGHAGLESDFEILELMLEMLAITGIENVHIDLGHVGIYRSLAVRAGLTAAQEQQLFAALQRKAITDINDLLDQFELPADIRSCFTELADLNGGSEVLQRARQSLAIAGEAVVSAIDEMQQFSELLKSRLPDLPVHYDLAELRGYAYQTGLVFAAFIPGYGQEIARGGRYDDIGKIFGRARPATGFSADLKTLVSLSAPVQTETVTAIYAPATDDESLYTFIKDLRSQGERVIRELPGQTGSPDAMECDRQIKQVDGKWQVVEI